MHFNLGLTNRYGTQHYLTQNSTFSKVGDFGLARWPVNGQLAEERRVIGAFGCTFYIPTFKL